MYEKKLNGYQVYKIRRSNLDITRGLGKLYLRVHIYIQVSDMPTHSGELNRKTQYDSDGLS